MKNLWSKSCPKIVQKLSKNCQKLSKNCQNYKFFENSEAVRGRRKGRRFVVPRPGATLSHLVIMRCHISRGIGSQFKFKQRSALYSLEKNSCRRCKQTKSPDGQLRHLKTSFNIKTSSNVFFRVSYIVQGVNNT
jgi:hypothetical protein